MGYSYHLQTPCAIAREVGGLLRDETRRKAMSINAYRLGRQMVWSSTAALYMSSFRTAASEGDVEFDGPASSRQVAVQRREASQEPSDSLCA